IDLANVHEGDREVVLVDARGRNPARDQLAEHAFAGRRVVDEPGHAVSPLLFAIRCSLFAAGCWLLAAGCWLLAGPPTRPRPAAGRRSRLRPCRAPRAPRRYARRASAVRCARPVATPTGATGSPRRGSPAPACRAPWAAPARAGVPPPADPRRPARCR